LYPIWKNIGLKIEKQEVDSWGAFWYTVPAALLEGLALAPAGERGYNRAEFAREGG
jgi:hypothetical protein